MVYHRRRDIRFFVSENVGVNNRILNRQTEPSYDQLSSQLDLWFQTEFGQRMLSVQRDLIDQKLSQCFGYHLLQMSVSASSQLFNDCRVQRQYRYVTHSSQLSPSKKSETGAPFQAIQGGYEQLPFDSNSVDVVVLHHVQEFIENPHQLLREIQRVVVPRGSIILVGFNPWSPLGAYSRMAKYLPNSVWHNQLISCHRICDWLSLLGFDVSTKQYGFCTPKVLAEKMNLQLMPSFASIPLGNFYCISAVKQQLNLTPIRPVWKTSHIPFRGLSPVKSKVGGAVSNATQINKKCRSEGSTEQSPK
jgi:SAM-dependent methyltransferase